MMSTGQATEHAHAFRIKADHPCLPGHFPGYPLVPAVMLLEQLAQALRDRYGMRIVRLVEAKFTAPLHPGEMACLQLEGEPPLLRFEIRQTKCVLARGRVEVAP